MKHLLCVLLATCSASFLTAAEPQYRISFAGGKASHAEVAGWNQSEMKALEQRFAQQPQRGTEVLAVYVDSPSASDAVAVLGTYKVFDDKLRFTPRFPFLAGVKYRVVLHSNRIAGDSRSADEKPLVQTFELPAPAPSKPPRLVRAYPSRNVLPENQLKFYLHFSAPMSRGESYQNIHLLRADGSEVDMPFLRLGEELWDETGRRFTLFFDPGRIKRGLSPREQFGPSLEEGKQYTLVVDRRWRDAQGQPLAETFRKPFKVVAPDDVQPDPQKWRLSVPAAGAGDAFVVTFREPLDHAMLQRVLAVTDSTGKAVAGRITVDANETRWRFTPAQPWKAGSYQLVIATTLEDRAGNSIGRPFEVDTWGKTDRPKAAPTVSLPFRIKGS